MTSPTISFSRPALRRMGFGEDAVPYLDAWDEQRRVHAGVVDGSCPDTDGTPVIDVDRGGMITWHGPGQLVGYPLVRLEEPIDVVEHVRRLEAMLMDVCAELGLETYRVEGRTGVWVAADSPLEGTRPERKIAAIGVRVSRGVTMHGFALNCDCDLTWFDRIVPCGISDAGVTSLSVELGRDVTVLDVLPLVEARLADGLGRWSS